MYKFPESLAALRNYLRCRQVDVQALKSARQAAFIAQQLLGTRIKFPPQGSDMLPTLLSIQKAIASVDAASIPSRSLPSKSAKAPANQGKKAGRAKAGQANNHNIVFTEDIFAKGIHIFCDGAAVPNPGIGGWGVVVYEDGVEIQAQRGGILDTTNNVMELTGMLQAIEVAKGALGKYKPVRIWCDSMYVVNGCNGWRHKWKRNGWSRKGPNAKKPETGRLANSDLWMAIDELLSGEHGTQISIGWVKGHAGIRGNERADQLASIGRKQALDLVERGQQAA